MFTKFDDSKGDHDEPAVAILPSMKDMKYMVVHPFVVVAYPLQETITIANMIDKEQPLSVLQTDGLFLRFAETK